MNPFKVGDMVRVTVDVLGYAALPKNSIHKVISVERHCIGLVCIYSTHPAVANGTDANWSYTQFTLAYRLPKNYVRVRT